MTAAVRQTGCESGCPNSGSVIVLLAILLTRLVLIPAGVVAMTRWATSDRRRGRSVCSHRPITAPADRRRQSSAASCTHG